tara:strand:- start:3179 stop:4489 length:1311 start_codon:yes stop_codon:yes gene_type:complete
MSFDIIFKNANITNDTSSFTSDIGIKSGKISEIGDLGNSSDNIIELDHLNLIPGVIDTQVHFREPGAEHKEDLSSGTKAAILGGVTGVFEMPNTDPSTTNVSALKDKFTRAKDRSYCDYAFYVGGTEDNSEILPELEKIEGCCGVKVFMGLSTGSLLVSDDKDLEKILSKINNRASFHSEDQYLLEERKKYQVKGDTNSHEIWRNDEQCFIATQRLLKLARKNKKNVHVLHVSTAQEIDLLSKNKDIASVEITPQHLTLLAPNCYQELGNYAQMNPPIRGINHQKKLWEAINNGVADIIGSDHAPHSREEKDQEYPNSPSGMPGVQTLVPIMLNHINEGKLTLNRFVELTSSNPARLFGIKNKGSIEVGNDADFTIIDIQKEQTIEDSWINSKCGWTPYNGMKVKGWPIMTIIRGEIVMREGEVTEPIGKPMNFYR